MFGSHDRTSDRTYSVLKGVRNRSSEFRYRLATTVMHKREMLHQCALLDATGCASFVRCTPTIHADANASDGVRGLAIDADEKQSHDNGAHGRVEHRALHYLDTSGSISFNLLSGRVGWVCSHPLAAVTL